MQWTDDFPSFRSGEHWVIGARTMLVDRIKADVERIRMPAAETLAGSIAFELQTGSITRRRPPGGRNSIKRMLKRENRVRELAGTIVDLRRYSPDNWAHMLLYLLPIAELARRRLKEPVTVVIPENTGGHITTILEYFGFGVERTNSDVRGAIVHWDIANFDIMNSARRIIIGGMLDGLDEREVGKPPTPDRIYVSRKDCRRVVNEEEIAGILAERGFTRLYAEELPPSEQLRIIRNAKTIVAIHGAGLAPIGYAPVRSPDAPLRILELMTPAVMNNWYRVMADQVGAAYLAVRGVIEPRHAREGARIDRIYGKHCDRDFRVDPVSLTIALDLVADAPVNRPGA